MYLNFSHNYQWRTSKLSLVNWAEPCLWSPSEWRIMKTRKAKTRKVSGKVKSLVFFLNRSKPCPSTILGSIWPLENPPETTSLGLKLLKSDQIHPAGIGRWVNSKVPAPSQMWVPPPQTGPKRDVETKLRRQGQQLILGQAQPGTLGKLSDPWEAIHTRKSNLNYLWSLMGPELIITS